MKRIMCILITLSLIIGLAACTPSNNTEVSDIVKANTSQLPLYTEYRRPAANWESDALPLGNGFIGAMVFGGVESDRIQLNEHTLWSGGPGANADYDGGMSNATAEQNYENLQKAREELQKAVTAFSENKYAHYEGGQLITNNYDIDWSIENNYINKLMGEKQNYGSYESLGNIYIDAIEG